MKILEDNQNSNLERTEMLISLLQEIKLQQKDLMSTIEKNNKIVMQRMNKLQEFNEISDMRNRYLYSELKLISQKLENLYN